MEQDLAASLQDKRTRCFEEDRSQKPLATTNLPLPREPGSGVRELPADTSQHERDRELPAAVLHGKLAGLQSLLAKLKSIRQMQGEQLALLSARPAQQVASNSVAEKQQPEPCEEQAPSKFSKRASLRSIELEPSVEPEQTPTAPADRRDPEVVPEPEEGADPKPDTIGKQASARSTHTDDYGPITEPCVFCAGTGDDKHACRKCPVRQQTEWQDADCFYCLKTVDFAPLHGLCKHCDGSGRAMYSYQTAYGIVDYTKATGVVWMQPTAFREMRLKLPFLPKQQEIVSAYSSLALSGTKSLYGKRKQPLVISHVWAKPEHPDPEKKHTKQMQVG